MVQSLVSSYKECIYIAGHIRQDNQTKMWMYSIEAGVDRAGKRKRKIKRGFKTKSEAKHAMTLAIAELEKEDTTNSETEERSMFLGDYLNYWLKTYVVSNTTHNTYKGYERIIRVHLLPALGKVSLDQLTVRDIQNYYLKKLRPPGECTKEGAGLSAQSVKHHHRVLCKALNDAVDWEFIDKNVALKAKPPKPEKVEIITYTSEQLNLLLKCAKESDLYYPIIYTAAHTGARVGELRALTWGDVDFTNRKIYFRKTAYDVKGKGVVIKNTTKNGRERAVIMGQKLFDFLYELKQKRENQKKLLGPSFNEHNLVFVNSKGNFFDVRDLGRAYKVVIKKAALPKSRFHDLRHTHATILLQKNVHPKVVSERLGHSKLKAARVEDGVVLQSF